jgi:hypothetical protein
MANLLSNFLKANISHFFKDEPIENEATLVYEHYTVPIFSFISEFFFLIVSVLSVGKHF